MPQFLKPGAVKPAAEGRWIATVIHHERGEVIIPHNFSRAIDAKRTMRYYVEIANGGMKQDWFDRWFKG
jgi:hypothetical protein